MTGGSAYLLGEYVPPLGGFGGFLIPGLMPAVMRVQTKLGRHLRPRTRQGPNRIQVNGAYNIYYIQIWCELLPRESPNQERMLGAQVFAS